MFDTAETTLECYRKYYGTKQDVRANINEPARTVQEASPKRTQALKNTVVTYNTGDIGNTNPTKNTQEHSRHVAKENMCYEKGTPR